LADARYENLFKEALTEAVSSKEYENRQKEDQFARIRKPFVSSRTPASYLDQGHWKKVLEQLK